MIPVKLIFSNAAMGENIVIKEESGNFKDLEVSKETKMMTVNLNIPNRIQKLNLTAHNKNNFDSQIKLNGGNYLLVDPKYPPSKIIIVHKPGSCYFFSLCSFSLPIFWRS